MNISVIIPCRNMAATLPSAVNSAVKAGATEIIIVNDNSTDNTIKTALTVCGGRTRLVNVPLSDGVAAGVCFARNFGIAQAQCPLIVPLDADDELTDDGLRILYDAYTPNLFVYGSWIEQKWRDYPSEGTGMMLEEAKSAPPLIRLKDKNVTHATFLFAKSDWRKVGGYNPTFEAGAEDYAFMCALVNAGVQGVRADGYIYRKRTTVQARTDAIKNSELKQGLLRLLLHETYPKVFNGSKGYQEHISSGAYQHG